MKKKMIAGYADGCNACYVLEWFSSTKGAGRGKFGKVGIHIAAKRGADMTKRFRIYISKSRCV